MDAGDDDSTPRSCRTSSEARTADRIFKVMVWNSFRDLRGRREAVRDAMLGQGMRACAELYLTLEHGAHARPGRPRNGLADRPAVVPACQHKDPERCRAVLAARSEP